MPKRSGRGLTKKQALQWAQALESGKYSQCRKSIQEGESYCCLGVLSEELGFRLSFSLRDSGLCLHEFCGLSYPATAMRISACDTGFCGTLDENFFVYLNDQMAFPFPEIAAVIRKELEDNGDFFATEEEDNDGND